MKKNSCGRKTNCRKGVNRDELNGWRLGNTYEQHIKKCRQPARIILAIAITSNNLKFLRGEGTSVDSVGDERIN